MNFTKDSLKNILKLYSEEIGVNDVLDVCKSFEDDQEELSESYQVKPNKLDVHFKDSLDKLKEMDLNFQAIISGE